MSKTVLHHRGGVSLMEVLIAIFVIMIGLLGLTALIPVGGVSIQQMVKADRTGTCGRAALRDVKVRRMLDPAVWFPAPDMTNPELFPFALDPLGVARGRTGNLGPLERRTMFSLVTKNVLTLQEATSIFQAADDLIFTIPDNPDERPFPIIVGQGAGMLIATGDYTWFLTVCPSAGESSVPVGLKTQYTVSVVVCYKRQFTDDGEVGVGVTFLGTGLGGGSIQLSLPEGASAPKLKEGHWIMLAGGTQCKWYRVVTIGSGPVDYISLNGPDWDRVNSDSPTAVIISDVVGVYTKPIELDRDPKWYVQP